MKQSSLFVGSVLAALLVAVLEIQAAPKHAGPPDKSDQKGERVEGPTLESEIQSLKDLDADLAKKGIYTPFRHAIDALSKVKSALELEKGKKKLPPSLLNWFQTDVKLTEVERKGVQELAKMLLFYTKQLVALDKEMLSDVDKKELAEVDKALEDINSKVAEQFRLKPTAQEKKYTLASIRTMREFRSPKAGLKIYKDPQATELGVDIHSLRDGIAGILPGELAEGLEELEFSDLFMRASATGQFQTETLINKILTLSK